MAQLGQHVADDRLAAAREGAEFPGGPILTDGGQAAEERALAQLGQQLAAGLAVAFPPLTILLPSVL